MFGDIINCEGITCALFVYVRFIKKIKNTFRMKYEN